jgi:FKBP-type peptidyl-prolyl cis-trans isomerase 2
LFIKNKMVVKKGNKVKIEYEGSLDSGEVFDSSQKQGQLLEFVIGEGQVIPGFENAVIGMEKGQEKTVKIKSKEAYGEKNMDLMKQIDKQNLPEEIRGKVQPGMVLGMQSPDGRQIPVMIAEVDENTITLDLNHPLAGKNINFKIKLIDFE